MFPLLFCLIAVLGGLLSFCFAPYSSGGDVFELVKPPVLLLTAHPDDEVMFFAPTIQTLLANKIPLHILCLSTGGADGLGKIREVEYKRSIKASGVNPVLAHILDNPKLQDNFTTAWKDADIATAVQPFIKDFKIQTIMTFDSYGVSGHPNHASLPQGVLALRSKLSTKKGSNPPKLLTLVSRHILLKYTGPLLSPGPGLKYFIRFYPSTFIDPRTYLFSLKAMREHRSQLVWFRYLYIVFSRYMYINEWTEWK